MLVLAEIRRTAKYLCTKRLPHFMDLDQVLGRLVTSECCSNNPDGWMINPTKVRPDIYLKVYERF